MVYIVEITPKAKRELKTLPKAVLVEVACVIDALVINPRPKGCKNLKGVKGILRIRVGDYRILYRVIDSILQVLVIRIGNRREVYRDLTASLKSPT